MILAFNKPYGVLSQFNPQVAGQRTLDEFKFPKNVYPIGRLDMDSEGLLLLSDEGQWSDLLLHPRHGHERTYHVQVEGEIEEAALIELRKGVAIQDWKTRPCQVSRLSSVNYSERNPPIRFRKSIPTSWMELKLIEGKNRQVRRMTAAVGFPTLRLIRVASGSLKLGDLEPGTWCALSTEQIRMLLQKPRK
ncbi:MAG: pseudouridine synthase [Candidatus Omnitrophica bacterium]|nr:pseudouridine synthase [Candidatus Omnitrophota bacterium]